MMSDSDQLKQRVGTNVRRAREAAGLTQAELAAQIGEEQPAISRWERGGAMPRPAALIAIARALGVTVPDLFADGTPAPNGEAAA